MPSPLYLLHKLRAIDWGAAGTQVPSVTAMEGAKPMPGGAGPTEPERLRTSSCPGRRCRILHQYSVSHNENIFSV
jgi:hypothetical protein